MNRQWRVVAVDRHGQPYEGGSLRAAQVTSVSPLAPSRRTSWTFQLPVGDPGIVACGLPTSTDTDGDPFREVQLWYGDTLVRWGPIVGWQIDGAWATIDCADCFWWFERRVMGQVHPTNFLGSNADWSDGLTGWTTHLPAGCTATVLDGYSTFAAAGTPVLKVDNSTSPANVDDDTAAVHLDTKWVASAFPHTVTLHARALLGDEDSTPNHRRSGVGLLLLPIEGYDDPINDAYRSSWFTLDERSPYGVPLDVTVSLEIPATADFIVQVRFEGTLATCYWDGSANVLADQDGLGFQGEDQAEIARKVIAAVTGDTDSDYTFAVEHPNYPYTTDGMGWDDLNIRPDIDTTGVVRDRRWFFESRPPGKVMLDDFAALDDGLEFSIVYDADAGTRTITGHHPKMGSARPDIPLRYGIPGSNIASYALRFEGQAGNEYADGLLIDQSFAAPVDWPPDQLLRFAANRWNDIVTPWTLEVVAAEAVWIDQGLREGDRVPVQIRDNQVRVVDSAMWVRSIQPTLDGFVTLTITRWPGYL